MRATRLRKTRLERSEGKERGGCGGSCRRRRVDRLVRRPEVAPPGDREADKLDGHESGQQKQTAWAARDAPAAQPRAEDAGRSAAGGAPSGALTEAASGSGPPRALEGGPSGRAGPRAGDEGGGGSDTLPTIREAVFREFAVGCGLAAG